MKKLRKNKKGFTLVELVVVIAILAILASTATVATIAILNNARKTPVSDAASSVKNQMEYYVLMDGYDANLTGFIKYMGEQMPDVVVDTAAGTSVSKPSDDKIHIKVSNSDNLKTNAWSSIVYTQYYQCKVTFNVVDGKLSTASVGSVDKMS